MNKQILFISIFFFGLLNPINAQTKVDFIEEYIDFEINETHFSINGIYSFDNQNKKAVTQQIYFPFAEKIANIDSIYIINLNTMEYIPFTKQEKGIYFDFLLLPEEIVDLNISYRQVVAKKNTYIVTTTGFWGKPLNKATYSLATPLNIVIDSCSYTPNDKKIEENKIYYLWEMNNFMPVLDFEFTINDSNVNSFIKQ